MISARILALWTVAAVFIPTGASAQSNSSPNKGRWVFSATIGGGFPTGRFGETDLEADPPKSGNDAGLAFGGDVSYYLNEFLLLGGAISHSRFDLDFGSEEESLYPTNIARTSVTIGEATVRVILARSLPWWKPYAVIGVGFGSPKAEVEYQDPRAFPDPNPENPPILVSKFESKVDMSVALSGGVGANIPVARNVAINVEGRYRNVATEGTDRTDTYTLSEGEVLEVGDKAKSDTQWWDLRAGLTITIP
ncbi:MAG: outer membrane beta-barrel protein [Candidatus Zixiibacteriota bacterium]